MNPQETHELAQTIRRIHKDFQLTIFLVEHDMHLVMDLCERLQVINYGRLLAEGDPSKVRANPEVVAAYLGSPDKKKRGKAC
jgi:branched-chain amino acid transport system ATP-binding protein